MAKTVRLYYNRSSGPLSNAKEVWIHGGHNKWKEGLTIVERLVKSGSKDADWWHADGMLIKSFTAEFGLKSSHQLSMSKAMIVKAQKIYK